VTGAGEQGGRRPGGCRPSCHDHASRRRRPDDPAVAAAASGSGDRV